MKNTYYLPGLNAIQHITNELIFEIDFQTMPMTYLFNSDTSAFYRKYCEGLDEIKLREKRFLDFETPNRALITHEYDMRIENDFDFEKFYYLFNPTERLSWLKISQEGKRLSVASSQVVKQIIRDVLIVELGSDAERKFELLWLSQKRLPCFIKLEKSDYKDFLLTASYYDSIRQYRDNNISKLLHIFSPLSERQITYDYFPLKNKSSWLYIKSPNNFNIKHRNSVFNPSNNEIDHANSTNIEADPEKISLTIINKESTDTLSDTVSFVFDIIVPKSLKIWFMVIYWLSLLIFGVLVGYFINMFYISISDPIWNINPLKSLITRGDFGGFVLAIIAAIIATRGWLIVEETIMKRYSIYLTLIMTAITIMYIMTLIV